MEYIFDPVELDLDYWQYLYYFIYQPVQTFVYNQDTNKPNRDYTRQFKKNMERAVERYSIGLQDKVINITREKLVELEKAIEENPPQVYDEKLGITKYYHVEYYWQAENSKNTCDVCKSRNGKKLSTIKDLKTHWNCRCTMLEHSWWTDDNGKIFDEKLKVL